MSGLPLIEVSTTEQRREARSSNAVLAPNRPHARRGQPQGPGRPAGGRPKTPPSHHHPPVARLHARVGADGLPLTAVPGSRRVPFARSRVTVFYLFRAHFGVPASPTPRWAWRLGRITSQASVIRSPPPPEHRRG